MAIPPMKDPASNVLVKPDGTRVTKSALVAALTSLGAVTSYQVPDGYTLLEKGDLPGDAGHPVADYQRVAPGMVLTTADIDAMYPAPTIDTVTPTGGTTAGGTAIVILGTNFKAAGTSVTVGGNAATSVVVVNSGRITCTTAAHASGATNVVVTTDAGTATKTNGFTFS